jgi:hypothetical protein
MKNFTSTFTINAFLTFLIFCFSTSCKIKQDKVEKEPWQQLDISKIRLSSLPKFDSIKYSALLKQVNIVGKQLPGYNAYEQFYILGYDKKQNYNILRLIHKDESCCTSMYYITISKPDNNILSCEQIATHGSDGDWTENDAVFIYNNEVKTIKLITQQNINSKTNKYDTQTQDSIVVNYILNKMGVISKTRLDSVRSYKRL